MSDLSVIVKSVNRVYKTRWFARFARNEAIGDDELCEAMTRARRGLIDADLGGGVIKQRIARPNEGRAGGFRSIVLFKVEKHAVFVYGFPKNQRDNITQSELKEFRAMASEILAFDDAQLQVAVDTEKLIKVTCNDQDIQK